MKILQVHLIILFQLSSVVIWGEVPSITTSETKTVSTTQSPVTSFSSYDETSLNSTNTDNEALGNGTDNSNSTEKEHHKSTETEERAYDLSYQVMACGDYCEGDQKRYKFELCGFYFSCMDCHCDDACTVYGDCCPDENGTLPKSVSGERFTCVRTDASSKLSSYYMIKSCPSISSDNNRIQQNHLKPVTSSLTDQTYYNEFYALCNNETDFVTWRNHSVCDDDDYYGSKEYESENCITIYEPQPSNIVHRTCSWQNSVEPGKVVDRCNVSGIKERVSPSLLELCQSTEFLVGGSHDIVYKNMFCYVCNEAHLSYNCFVPIEPRDQRVQTVNVGNSSVPIEHTFLITLNELVRVTAVADRNAQAISISESDNCTGFEWEDPVSVRCNKIHCMDGRYLEDGNCMMDNHTIADTEYKMELQLKTFSSVFQDCNAIVDSFRDNIPRLIANFDPLIYFFYIHNLIDYDKLDNTNVSYQIIGLTLTFRSIKASPAHTYENNILNFVWGDWVFFRGDTQVIFKPQPWDFSMDSSNWENLTFNPLTKARCDRSTYSIDGFSLIPKTIVSLTDALSCPYVVLNEDAYELEDGLLKFVGNNITLNRKDYHKSRYEIQVCLSTLEDVYGKEESMITDGDDRQSEKETLKLIQGYLSVACTCVSMICILLTMITVLKFPILWTLPNKNTMFLAGSIFAAQATFQFGVELTSNKTVCQIIGIAIHFLWLSVAFWMNVCSFHMFRALASSFKTKVTRTTLSSHRKSLLKYAGYVYGMSSAIISATVAASYGLSNGTSIGYGDRLCYINDPFITGLAFVLPLGIVIISNIFFFILTVHAIHKTSKVQGSSSADRKNVIVYMKLSTFTGAFWILAILAEVTNVTALAFMSTLLNGSQGLFIFVSYILNRRVCRLWVSSSRKATSTQTRSRSVVNTRF